MYTRTRGRRYDTATFAVRNTRGPRFGINVINTEHRPLRTPFTLVPTNMQLRDPDTMVNLILPCDVFGMVIDTCRASVRAARYLPRFTVSVVDDAVNCCCELDASVVDVVEDVVTTDVVVEARVVVVANVVVVASVVVVAAMFNVPTETADV